MVHKITPNTDDFGKRLCDAIGEPPDMVRSIEIRSCIDKPVTIILEKFVDNEQGEKIIKLLKKYIWIEDK